MIATAARYGARKVLTSAGVPEGAANFLSWLVWGGTIAVTADLLSLGAEVLTTAGTEVAVGVGGDAAIALTDVVGGAADLASVAADLAPVVVCTDVGLAVRSALSNRNGDGLAGRIVLIAADPSDETRLRLDREFRQISEKMRLSKLRDRFVLDSHLAARPEDLTQALLDNDAEIVHFSGHGTEAGCLCFENNSGEIVIVKPEAIGRVFAQLPRRVRCVVLNACYSAKQAKEILQSVDYVIGMSAAIGDEAAIAFASGFYQGVGGGLSIEKAFEIGKSTIQFEATNQHLIPILLKNEQI